MHWASIVYLNRKEAESSMVRLASIHIVCLHGIEALVHNDQIATGNCPLSKGIPVRPLGNCIASQSSTLGL